MYKNNVYGLGRVISILLLFYCLAYPLYHVRHREREVKIDQRRDQKRRDHDRENRSEKRQRE
jgi:hypothetical protein